MPKAKFHFIALVFVGVVLTVCLRVALTALASLAIPDPKMESAPLWYGISRPLLATLAQVAPAFIVGWLARQSGFLLGALVGAFSSLAISALFEVYWQNISFSPFNWFLLLSLVLWALTAAISSSVAGGAGELARSRLPSNYSFKRTADVGLR